MEYYECVQVMVHHSHGTRINQMFLEVNVGTLIISPLRVIAFWHNVAFIIVHLPLYDWLGASEEAK